MRYSVDVKAFMSIEVRADSAGEAKEAAEAFMRALEPAEPFVDGYNEGLARHGSAVRITRAWSMDVDGDSEILPLPDRQEA